MSNLMVPLILNPIADIWNDVSDECKDLISKMLVTEEHRLPAKEYLNHPWFSLHKNSLSKVNLSSRTLMRMKDFCKIVRLKRAILMFAAYRSNISRDEIKKQREIFLKLDIKRQGYMTYEEIKQLLDKHLDEATIKKVFSSMDEDQNGRIYWNEFLAATVSQAIFLKEENLKEAFNSFDESKKGWFNKEDLKNKLYDPDLIYN